MDIKQLLKDKSVKIGFGIILAVLLLALFTRGDKNIQDFEIESSQPASRTHLLQAKLPINIKDFATPIGITTGIDLYIPTGNSEDVIVLDITGLTYTNPDPSFFTNPEAMAYADSYRHAMLTLRDRGIDPSKYSFIYGSTDAKSKIASGWVSSLRLSP